MEWISLICKHSQCLCFVGEGGNCLRPSLKLDQQHLHIHMQKMEKNKKRTLVKEKRKQVQGILFTQICNCFKRKNLGKNRYYRTTNILLSVNLIDLGLWRKIMLKNDNNYGIGWKYLEENCLVAMFIRGLQARGEVLNSWNMNLNVSWFFFFGLVWHIWVVECA